MLVEVKATARKRLGTKVTTDMTKLLRHLSSVYMLRNGKYTAVIVTVQSKTNRREPTVRRPGGAVMTRPPDPMDELIWRRVTSRGRPTRAW